MTIRGPRAWTTFWAFGCLALLWAILAGREWLVPFPERYEIKPASMTLEKGKAYLAPLPRDFGDAIATLYEGRSATGQPLDALQGVLGWSRMHYWLNGLIARRFPETTRKITWTAIGPGDQVHEDIRKLGQGRYSVWKGALYLSTPDGSDPKLNGRTYRLEVTSRVPVALRVALVGATIALGAWLVVLVLAPVTRRFPGLRGYLPGVVISVVMVAVIFAGGELYARYKVSFVQTNWPAYLHPVAGWVFKPGEEVRHTNNADFWTRQKANSLGFLDKEPVLPKPPGTFRILVLGDSFVEAVQVTIDKKFPVLLEEQLRKDFPGRSIDVVAMGYSGTGQTNQLGFYEAFAAKVKPDLVIPLVISNDWANNSPVLESVRNGWYPYHPPRLFFEVDPAAPKFRRLEVDPTWDKHLLPINTGDVYKDYEGRIEWLRRDPAFTAKLEGWKYPNDLDFDSMFCAPEVPLAFREADDITAYTFQQLADAAKRDGARVLVVAADNVTTLCKTNAGTRPTREGTLIARVRKAAGSAGLELFDLEPAFAAKGDRNASHYRYDSHWSETGHRWVADALAEHFRRNPRLLSK